MYISYTCIKIYNKTQIKMVGGGESKWMVSVYAYMIILIIYCI